MNAVQPLSRPRARPLPAPALAVAGMLSLAVGMGIGRFAFTPVLPMMQADAGLSLTFAGWLAAANYLGYLAGAMAAVGLRADAGEVVRGALLVTALSTGAMGLVDSPAAWLCLRAVAGVASAWTLIFAAAWVLPALAAHDAGRLAGVHFAGVGLGTAITGALCLLLGAWEVSSAGTWLALGALALVLTWGCWPAFGSQRAPGTEAPCGPREDARPQRRRHWPLIVAYGGFGFGYIIPATFLPAMARDLVPDPAVFGWAWPVFGAAACASTLLSGPLRRRMSHRALWRGCQVLMALAVALPAVVDGLGAILLSALGVGGTFMVVTQAALEEARSLAPSASARLMALMTTAFAAGQVAGPVAVSVGVAAGLPVEALSWVAATLLLAVLPGIGARRR